MSECFNMECPGWEWIEDGGLHIERCDECNRFATDKEAEKFAYLEIQKRPEIIAIMKTFSERDHITAVWALMGNRLFRNEENEGI